MTKVQPSEFSVGVAYGTTPESALYATIQQHPEFTTRDAEYIGERPGFMRVKANEFDLHDWDQYDRADEGKRPSSKDEPPAIRDKVRSDLAADPRHELLIENVWTNLELHNPPDRASEGRAYVNFFLYLPFRESEFYGEKTAEIVRGDHIWRCEQKSTSLIDESS